MSAETGEDGEGFVTRWSRRKKEAVRAADEPLADAGLVSSNGLDANAAHGETRQKPTADLPPVESLTPDSDYTAFLSPKVSVTLRRQALRRLFHSSAIAGPDGLEDYDEDFRSFDPLDTPVTTDRTHRRNKGRATDTESIAPVAPERNAARDVALQTPGSTDSTAASSVEYLSRGRLLIIVPFRNVGDETRALELGAKLTDRLSCSLVLSRLAVAVLGEFGEQATAAGLSVVAGPEVSLAGYMGRFTATLHDGDNIIDVVSAVGGSKTFDLVLDLSDPPLLGAETPPPGYFAPGIDPAALDSALRELPSLIGTFQKPIYVRLDPNICGHSRDGIQGCRRCLDPCPTGAIRSVDNHIEVDPFLCQGGGSCGSICPTGALRYSHPPAAMAMEVIRTSLTTYYGAGGARAVLLFHDGGCGKEIFAAAHGDLNDRLVPVEVEEIGAVGLEMCLAALAYGAAAIGLLMTSTTPPSVIHELRLQLSIVYALLDGLELDPGRIQLVDGQPSHSLLRRLDPLLAWPALERATHSVFDDKRTNIRLAIDHLCAQATAKAINIPLPALAPFGQVIVEENVCTLCMACPSLCPTGALQAGSETPRLRFIEDNCIQCGLCRDGCPEAAIDIKARLYLDPEARRQPRTLVEDQPFLCVRCGSAFGTQRMIERITAKLSDHPMFSDDVALPRLKMCENCRVIEIFEAGGGTGR